MKTTDIAPAELSLIKLAVKNTFTRIGTKHDINRQAKEAKANGMVITSPFAWKIQATDPLKDHALVFRAINMGRGWAVTYSKDYYPES